MNRSLGYLGYLDPPLREPVQPPIVYVRDELVWAYKQLARNLAKEDAPTEAELNALGADGWELTAIFTDSPFVYFYFKRLADSDGN
ncbi:MAG: hypothetical protein M5U01_35885 [Ardenticatenaceae bacterium]|nr:hypothetical protein [Ardenticatenaceae bacterium]HBY97205.1 hypothetical protein [Chloroflexota bacterium]